MQREPQAPATHCIRGHWGCSPGWQAAIAAARDSDGDAQGTSSPQKPRPVLVKLSSRRTKGCIVEMRKRLEDNPYEYTVDNETNTAKIYNGDDLTKFLAKLAYQAYILSNDNLIKDNWVSSCKILVKDNFNRMTQVNCPQNLQKFCTG